MSTPKLSRITVFPVKSLPGTSVERAELVENGALAHDREFAVVDADGEYVNGKRTPRVHGLDATYDPETDELTLGERGSDDRRRFRVPDDIDDVNAWLSEYFGQSVELRRNEAGGFPDTTEYATGPTIISTATLRTVASWFPGVDADGMRRRLRANLVVEGVPAFWEDRLVGDDERVVAFEVGGTTIEGVKACPRCVVPSRDPDTGETYDGFRHRFIEKREATLPDWTPTDRFDHFFSLMVNTAVPPDEVGATLEVCDPVEVLGERPRRDTEPAP